METKGANANSSSASGGGRPARFCPIPLSRDRRRDAARRDSSGGCREARRDLPRLRGRGRERARGPRTDPQLTVRGTGRVLEYLGIQPAGAASGAAARNVFFSAAGTRDADESGRHRNRHRIEAGQPHSRQARRVAGRWRSTARAVSPERPWSCCGTGGETGAGTGCSSHNSRPPRRSSSSPKRAWTSCRGSDVPLDEPGVDAKADGIRAFRRHACKMATGTGKTTVMGMLAAWSILNKVADRGDARYSDVVLVVCPNVDDPQPARGN